MTEWTKLNCPKCNSLQDFKPRLRGKEAYIKCTTCKWESKLGILSDVRLAQERRKKRIASAKRRKEKYQQQKEKRAGSRNITDE